ncbi:hypothetical protein F3Y22_tig00113725pilonHSYRG00522 [Hibiscus syriacus]|uniref:Reverse transcriptase zinc-binding domain-containing protein n=1 Tax=Hibiscus syriacus TaxID=106335 RepID=A0A6A2WN45_HIBSY|nr:hypothetical protein F3Y22_tig00113725pilonHSYRG00522 [Hibiscus syriacus]
MPVGVVSKLNSIIPNFLWDSNSDRSIHWVKWESLCKPKLHGGLGIIDIHLKNRSLLNKWIWSFDRELDSLWRKVPLNKEDDMFKKDLPVSLGDGNSIYYWNDFWTSVPSLKVAFPRIYGLAIRKPEKQRKDALRWIDYVGWDLRMGYKLREAPPKVEFHTWRAVSQRLQVLVELEKRGISNLGSYSCVLCHKERERVKFESFFHIRYDVMFNKNGCNEDHLHVSTISS